jgi:hypothetical protein
LALFGFIWLRLASNGFQIGICSLFLRYLFASPQRLSEAGAKE